MATTVYTGADGTISVAVEAGPGGDAAKAVAEKYSLTPIGRATGVTVKVTNATKAFHELGQRFATELRPGNLNVTGSIGRAHINGALLRLCRRGGRRVVHKAPVAPSFNLSCICRSRTCDATRLTVMGVQINE
jgi:hypothetical protein